MHPRQSRDVATVDCQQISLPAGRVGAPQGRFQAIGLLLISGHSTYQQATAFGSNQPFCHSTLSGPTDQLTHRPTDGIGDSSIPRTLMLAILMESDALTINKNE